MVVEIFAKVSCITSLSSENYNCWIYLFFSRYIYLCSTRDISDDWWFIKYMNIWEVSLFNRATLKELNCYTSVGSFFGDKTISNSIIYHFDAVSNFEFA